MSEENKNPVPSKKFEGRITFGNHSDLKLYWDKSENYNCNCIVDLKASNSSYIRDVLKREVVSPVCNDGYYVGGGYALKDLPLIYDRLQEYEDLGSLEEIKDSLKHLEDVNNSKVNDGLEDFENMMHEIFQVDSDFENYADKVKQSLSKAKEQEKENVKLKGQVNYLTEVGNNYQKILNIIEKKGFNRDIKNYDDYDTWLEQEVEKFGKAIEKHPTILSWDMFDDFIYTKEEFSILKEWLG